MVLGEVYLTYCDVCNKITPHTNFIKHRKGKRQFVSFCGVCGKEVIM